MYTKIMSLDWNNSSIVSDYVRSSNDPEKHWYENEVNIPSVLNLLGNKKGRLLDFGCGPGGLTAQLATDFAACGADGSELMVAQARRDHPGISFFVWDGSTPLPADVAAFDTIVSKLTMEFIPDLDKVAAHLHAALVPGGSLVISVAHPMLVAHKYPDDPYWETSATQTQIGSTGIVVTKINRSLQAYLNPFLDNGFTVAHIDEPAISPAAAKQHGVSPSDLRIPKRLNIRFVSR